MRSIHPARLPVVSLAPWAALLFLVATACAPPDVDQHGDSGGSSGDAGSADGGTTDGGGADGGSTDGGSTDGGLTDGGLTDGGEGSDGGAEDGGAEDGGAAQPATINILFPDTSSEVVICPTFVMVVDVDGLELVDFADNPDHVDGQGHWHVYDGGNYLAAHTEAWGEIELDNDGTVQAHSVSVSLSGNDHAAMGIEDTVEILVGPEGCIGGDVPDEAGSTAEDTGGRDTGAG